MVGFLMIGLINVLFSGYSKTVLVNKPKTIVLLYHDYLRNGFSHHYHLGESTFICRGVRSDF